MARIHRKQIAVVSLRDEYDIAAAQELAPYLHYQILECSPYPGDQQMIILNRSWGTVVWFVVSWWATILRHYRNEPNRIFHLTERNIRYQVERARKYRPNIDREDF